MGHCFDGFFGGINNASKPIAHLGIFFGVPSKRFKVFNSRVGMPFHPDSLALAVLCQLFIFLRKNRPRFSPHLSPAD